MSVLPPAPNGTMTVTDRVGQSWLLAALSNPTRIAMEDSNKAKRRKQGMLFPNFLGGGARCSRTPFRGGLHAPIADGVQQATPAPEKARWRNLVFTITI